MTYPRLPFIGGIGSLVGGLYLHHFRESPTMPISFPHRDNATGELVDVDYFTPKEVAARLHVSKETVWRNCANDRWPHLRVMNRYYLNAEQVARVLELMTHDPDQIPLWEGPPRLGVAVDPDEIEGIR